jgi:hypothetical protein
MFFGVQGAHKPGRRTGGSASGIVVLVCGIVAQSRFGQLRRDGRLRRNSAGSSGASDARSTAIRQSGDN